MLKIFRLSESSDNKLPVGCLLLSERCYSPSLCFHSSPAGTWIYGLRDKCSMERYTAPTVQCVVHIYRTARRPTFRRILKYWSEAACPAVQLGNTHTPCAGFSVMHILRTTKWSIRTSDRTTFSSFFNLSDSQLRRKGKRYKLEQVFEHSMEWSKDSVPDAHILHLWRQLACTNTC